MGKVLRLLNFMLAALFLSWAFSLDFTALTTLQITGLVAIIFWFILKLRRAFFSLIGVSFIALAPCLSHGAFKFPVLRQYSI